MNIVVALDDPGGLDEVVAMLQPFAAAHHIAGLQTGSAVLAQAQAEGIDLLITGIQLPAPDGLELIRRLRQQPADFAAIILSGSAAFEDAQAALRLGVADFLLEPVGPALLQPAVEAALSGLAARRAQRNQAREARLVHLLLGGAGAAGEGALGEHWGVIVTVCENWDGPSTWHETAVDQDFVRRALAAERSERYAIADLDGQRRVILVPPERARLPQIEMAALRVHQAIQAAGVIVHTAYDWKHAGDRPGMVLRRVLARLSTGMRLEASTFLHADWGAPPAGERIPGDCRQLLAHGLAQSGPATIPSEVHAALDRLHSCGASQPTIVQTLADLCELLRAEIGGEAARCLPAREAITAAVRGCRSYAELAAWIDAQVQPCLAAPQGPATPRELVGKLAALIEASYREGVSLQAFAAEHGVSLAYFSRLFKAQTGLTFTDYLIRVRIDRAKELLARPDLRLADVSVLVGYDDPKYFAQVFRKVAGVAPLDYQRDQQL